MRMKVWMDEEGNHAKGKREYVFRNESQEKLHVIVVYMFQKA